MVEPSLTRTTPGAVPRLRASTSVTMSRASCGPATGVSPMPYSCCWRSSTGGRAILASNCAGHHGHSQPNRGLDRAAGRVYSPGSRGSWASRQARSRSFPTSSSTAWRQTANRSRRLGDVGCQRTCALGMGRLATEHAASCRDAVCAPRPARSLAGSNQRRTVGGGVPRPEAPAHLPSGQPGAFRLRRRDQSASPRLAPRPRGQRKEQLEFSNLLALGEVVLGYPNEYGLCTDRPLLNPAADPERRYCCQRRGRSRPARPRTQRRVSRTAGASAGRQGLLAVHRPAGEGVPERRDALAAAMVGRTTQGAPLVPLARAPIPGIASADAAATSPTNQFTYVSDPDGVRCPLGAHIRRANPRTADLPGGRQGLLSRLLRMLGFKRAGVRDDLVASTRFHRLLRRGRKYGEPLSLEEALQPGPANEPRGLHFACLVANISRQFEFVQNAWMTSVKFDGFADESDPLGRQPRARPGLSRHRPVHASRRRVVRRSDLPGCRASSPCAAGPTSSCRESERCVTSQARPTLRFPTRPNRNLRRQGCCWRCTGLWWPGCTSSGGSSLSSGAGSTACCASRWPRSFST